MYKEIQTGAVAKSYMWGLPNIWGNAQIFSHIWGGHLSYLTLQPLPSEFPNTWRKFNFLFYQCTVIEHDNFETIQPTNNHPKLKESQSQEYVHIGGHIGMRPSVYYPLWCTTPVQILINLIVSSSINLLSTSQLRPYFRKNCGLKTLRLPQV